jgi:hypothetical protein
MGYICFNIDENGVIKGLTVQRKKGNENAERVGD